MFQFFKAVIVVDLESNFRIESKRIALLLPNSVRRVLVLA